MAVLSGTNASVETVPGYADSGTGYQLASVIFNVSGTYVQADNAILSGVPTLIQNSRRNGKPVTMRSVIGGRPATSAADPSVYMWCKTAAISTNDVTFEITLSSYSTEHTDATALPSQARPFELLVGFTEA